MTTQSKTTYSSQQHSPYQDSGRLHALQIMLCSRLDELLAGLGVKLYRTQKYFHGSCPIHGGKNQGAINLYRTGDIRPGFWVCNTRHCEAKFKKTIIGFVRGVLSHQKFGWTSLENPKKHDAQPIVGWKDTVDYCCDFLGKKIEDIEVDNEELEKVQFAAGMNVITRRPQQEKKGATRSQVRQWLQIPATYFVKRGWSPEILDKYDVGLYPLPNRDLSERVVVPVYDDDHDVAVGFTGRSIWPACEQCGRWHNPASGCPQEEADVKRSSKWWNQGFKRESYLYNHWSARKAIAKLGIAALCEGPGDVWKLEEADIHIGLGMFGLNLSDQQQVILETSGAMSIIVLTDSDEAGEQAKMGIKQRLGRVCRLYFPTLPKHDLGEMSTQEIKAVVEPVLNLIKERGY